MSDPAWCRGYDFSNLRISTNAPPCPARRLLDKVNGHFPFIVLSFLIRIIEAMGNAAFLTASFAIIAKEFPDNVATTFVSSRPGAGIADCPPRPAARPFVMHCLQT